MAPNSLLQRKSQHSQLQLQAKPPPLSQHQQPSASRRSHRTLPKDQTQLLSLQHDHRQKEERQRQREAPVAPVQKLTVFNGHKAAAPAAAAAAGLPGRPASTQRTAVNPAPPSQARKPLSCLKQTHHALCFLLVLSYRAPELRCCRVFSVYFMAHQVPP